MKFRQFVDDGWIIAVAMAAALTVLLLAAAGCGHNVGTAFQGKVFNVGYDPELNKFGVQYYNGAMVTGLQKEKSKTSFSYTDNVDADGKKTGSTLTYSTENGDQITGYRVKLEEAKRK